MTSLRTAYARNLRGDRPWQRVVKMTSKTLILSRDLGTWRVWHKGLGNMLRFRSNKDIHDPWLTQIPADRVRASARPISDFGPISEVTRGGDDDFTGK